AGLGAEFFRWEFATAVAGSVLGINPFDEPNVSEAKEKTKASLAKRDFSGGTPVASAGGVSVFSPRFSGGAPADAIEEAIESLGPREYRGVPSYLPAAA